MSLKPPSAANIAVTSSVLTGDVVSLGDPYGPFGQIYGDGITDDLDRFNAIYDAVPEGTTLFLPPDLTMAVSGQIVLDRHVHLVGPWSRRTDESVVGATIVPTSAAVQAGMRSLVKVVASYVTVSVAVIGEGAASGSVGLLFEGPDPDAGPGGVHCHGSTFDRCFVSGFAVGVELGAFCDHINFEGGQITGNTDGVLFAVDNHFDFGFHHVLLDGNSRASLRLAADYSVANVTLLRCHLGFGQYGVYQDATATGDGFAGLTLIDTPIEYVSVQHMKLRKGGHIRIQGGYWTWNGTPANAAVDIDEVNVGPIWFSPRLEAGTPNASCPALVRVNSYTNYNIYFDYGPMNGFAVARFSGNALYEVADGLAEVAPVWIPGSDLVALSGSPAVVMAPGASGMPVFAYDAAGDEVGACTVVLPNAWTTFKLSIFWTNLGAGAGDVQWQVWTRVLADGGAMTQVYPSGAEQTVTAPAQNVVKKSLLKSPLSSTPGAGIAIGVNRVGSNVTDTLANDAGLIGILLEKVSA